MWFTVQLRYKDLLAKYARQLEDLEYQATKVQDAAKKAKIDEMIKQVRDQLQPYKDALKQSGH
jgi:hypothetical protein